MKTVYHPDIHHRHSIRLKEHDYSQPGAYFVTICTKDRECLFGEILQGEIRLNDYGIIVQEEWLQTAILRPDVVLDEFVVMPNHFHAIVVRTGHSRGVL